MSVSYRNTIRRHNPGDRDLNHHRSENNKTRFSLLHLTSLDMTGLVLKDLMVLPRSRYTSMCCFALYNAVRFSYLPVRATCHTHHILL